MLNTEGTNPKTNNIKLLLSRTSVTKYTHTHTHRENIDKSLTRKWCIYLRLERVF